MNRRTWLSMAAAGVCGALAPQRMRAQDADRSELERRIGRVIDEYAQQGFHRTGTAVDRRSGDWLHEEVRRVGLTPAREPFDLNRIDPAAAGLACDGRRIEGLPLFDGAFTTAEGIRGRLGPLNSDADIGLVEAPPNTAGAGAFGAARREARHRAIVCVTRGTRPGLCLNNADAFLKPFGPPVLQVSSEESAFLNDQAKSRAEVTVIAPVARVSTTAFNVTTMIKGRNAALPPLVVMTPRSGWYWCASERGGGIACWLELMVTLRAAPPVREVLFVASSGHELGHLGIDAFVARRPGIVPKSVGWIHLGANIGAGHAIAGNTIQASDDAFEAVLSGALTSAGLVIGRRAPRGAVPGGEAEAVHRGGGRYASVIGSNALFHNPDDCGPSAVDVHAVARFTKVFAEVAGALIASP